MSLSSLSKIVVPLGLAALLLSGCASANPDKDQRAWAEAMEILPGVEAAEYTYINHKLLAPPDHLMRLVVSPYLSEAEALAISEASCSIDAAFTEVTLTTAMSPKQQREVAQPEATAYGSGCLGPESMSMFAHTVAAMNELPASFTNSFYVFGFDRPEYTAAPNPQQSDSPYSVAVDAPNRAKLLDVVRALHSQPADYPIEFGGDVEQGDKPKQRFVHAVFDQSADIEPILTLLALPFFDDVLDVDVTADTITLRHLSEGQLASPEFADLNALATASGITLNIEPSDN